MHRFSAFWHMRLPHRLQGQKVKSQSHGVGAYCGGHLAAQLVITTNFFTTKLIYNRNKDNRQIFNNIIDLYVGLPEMFECDTGSSCWRQTAKLRTEHKTTAYTRHCKCCEKKRNNACSTPVIIRLDVSNACAVYSLNRTYQIESETGELHRLENAVSNFLTHPQRYRFIGNKHCYRIGPEPSFIQSHVSTC